MEVDKWWHAQLMWHFECVAATMFAPLSVVHGTFSASRPASIKILSKVICMWSAVLVSGKNL